jgi:hypothetical protein
VNVFSFRSPRPRSKVSNRVHVPLAKGMFRGARSAADRDKCDVADLLLMQGHMALMAARARAGRSPGSAAKYMAGTAAMVASSNAGQLDNYFRNEMYPVLLSNIGN